MLVDRLAGGIKSIQASGQARADQPCQYIAGARAGEPCVAGGVDDRRLPRRGDDGARAFEHDRAGKALGQLPASGQAIPLHLRSVAAEQARGFKRVRRQHGGRAALATRAQQGLQLGVIRY